jgi:DNA modification methylase
MDYINTITNTDCIEFMKSMTDDMVDLTLTDIPYGEVNRADNGLRSLDKGLADVMQFDLTEFLNEVYRTTKGTVIIFCGKEQLSPIHKFFSEKQARHLGTVRQLVWEKTNPSPMNGQYIYLSGIENAVWFKKRGGAV